MKGQEIPRVYKIKYLGVTIDSELTFKQHIEEKIKSAKKQLMILRKKVTSAHGPLPRALKWVYEGVVLPSITYGCHVWATKLGKKQLGKLNKLNSLALRIIAPSFPPTPTAGTMSMWRK